MSVEINHASLGYAGRTVLQDVSFTLQSGSLCCLLGANGSGKTTLMRSILGVLPLRSGEILLNGQPVGLLSPAARARAIAWVPQAHEGAFAFSVMDMVMMGLIPHLGTFSQPGRKERDDAADQLAALGITHLAGRNWKELSGGERQLVLIARALVQRPQLLLLDELASSLDFGHQISLLETLKRLQQTGMTLLMATHHPQHARAIADTVIRIEPDGRVTQGPVNHQLQVEHLAELYRVTPEQIRHHLGNTHIKE